MNRYLSILFVCAFAGWIALPGQVSAASITETKAAIGEGCVASGTNSTAMGYKTVASGDNSTAMGYKTVASGTSSTAMGNNTTASGNNSTAMGEITVASGINSTAMGYYTIASGWSSTAMGHRIIASNVYSTVIGVGWDQAHSLVNDVEGSFMVGYMDSETDTIPEFFVKRGGVGINTTSPVTSLHVKRSISGGASMANHVAAIENTSTDLSPDVLGLKVNIENPGVGCNFITFADSTGNLGSIEGNGGSIQLNTSGGDFAEYLPKAEPDETLTPGDIVGLFPQGLSKKTHHAQRIMVVATAPAVLGNQPKEKDESQYTPVAFLGQVPVRVEGAVFSGDYIVPSGRGDGIGRAVALAELTPAQYGDLVGMAVESSSEIGVKTVTTLVGLPQNGLWNNAMAAKDARIAQLEGRLAALEAKTEYAGTPSLLPGAGIIMGSLALFRADRRRKRS